MNMLKYMALAGAVFAHLIAWGMDNPDARSKEQKNIEMVKKVVQEYLPKNTDLLVHSGNKNYPHPLIDSTPFIHDEVAKSVITIRDDGQEGAMWVHNSIILVDLLLGKFKRNILIQPKKIDDADKQHPAFTAMSYVTMAGEPAQQIILGGNRGKIFIHKPGSDEVKLFGKVSGAVKGFVSDPAGKQIAARVISLGQDSLPVPCFALARAVDLLEKAKHAAEQKHEYLAVGSPNTYRRSWAPTAGYQWSEFVEARCDHEVGAIRFDGDHCITTCSFSKKDEAWMVINPLGKAELKKIEKPSVGSPRAK